MRSGSLALARAQDDPDFPGRRHLRFDQRVSGVRVFGAQLVQQVGEDGSTLSVSGTVDEGLSLDVRPTLRADQAAREAERTMRARLDRGRRARARRPRSSRPVPCSAGRRGCGSTTSSSACSWTRAREGSCTATPTCERRPRSASGPGCGATARRSPRTPRGAASAPRTGCGRRRSPPTTFGTASPPPGKRCRPGASTPLSSPPTRDNDWTDGAVVDAHAYAGWTYDYYFKRHGRRGIDGRDLAVRSVTHFVPPFLRVRERLLGPLLERDVLRGRRP